MVRMAESSGLAVNFLQCHHHYVGQSGNRIAGSASQRHKQPGMALYSDKAGIFRINNKNAIGGDGHTQFGRAMHELNIQTICAETSQAKGRVERAHSSRTR